MIASLVLPAALFGYASWVSYRDIHAVTDERIGRSLDVMQEHALKVFQTVDRTFAEVNEILRGMSEEDIRVDQPRLHERLARIVATMPQLYGILLVDRHDISDSVGIRSRQTAEEQWQRGDKNQQDQDNDRRHMDQESVERQAFACADDDVGRIADQCGGAADVGGEHLGHQQRDRIELQAIAH